MKPAILGGDPIRKKPLPYASQSIDQKDCDAVTEVLKSDFLTTGPTAKRFEVAIAEYVGAKYAVSFSSGTAALHGACHAAGVGIGDEVITSPITFAASANCALYLGATPVFADINEKTFNIDVKEIEKKITNKTKAIIPVDFTGQSVDIGAINELVKGTKIVVIQDAAHSFGTKYRNTLIGGLADMTEFSFHPVKTLTTGEGGMITTNNEEIYKKLVNFRSHCITRELKQFANETHGGWYYEQLDLGFNYRLTDFQAALGISQLSKIDGFIQRRKDIVNKYNEAFKNLEGIILQENADFSDTTNHLYVIRLDLSKLKVDRKMIYDSLIAEHIGAHVHYIPVYWHPYYQKIGYKKGLCPKAEALYESMLTLPLFPAMTDQDVQDVIDGVFKIIEFYRK
ncbi:MAG: UDP-4-amino-4,6-dideoxy-N-acetyl-beta-L-altrosamine transaminase [Bacillales bacterium]|jgi:UDP-4-amino-4,6-dideoxy-N-acetyl-beta-L-altrosamine transaminase|nr:UDP-4-amino-4,6-dideoxy-N-acetyl-beta-L-altrosamine transaminase [Bacillales bacterium]